MGRMRCSAVVCSALSVAVSSCASFRDLETSVAPRLIDLITNVECDLTSGINEARQAGYSQVEDWNAIISFTLNTDVTNKGEVTLAVAPPVSSGSLSLGVGGSALGKATSSRVVKYALPFGFVPAEECDRIQTRIAGSVGAGRWLNDVLLAFSETQRDTGAGLTDFVPPQSLSTNATFLIRRTGNAGPSFALVPIGTSRTGGAAIASADWGKSHEISITISPPAEKPAAKAARSRKVAPANLRRLEQERTQFLLQELLTD